MGHLVYSLGAFLIGGFFQERNRHQMEGQDQGAVVAEDWDVEPASGPERRDGDWDCEECGVMNFASRTACFKCGIGRNGEPVNTHQGGHGGGSRRRPGDRDCAECGALVFGSRNACFRCNAPRSNGGGSRGNRRAGDWDCPECGVLVFSYKDQCFKCNTPRPSGGGGGNGGGYRGGYGGGGGGRSRRREGDWDCAACGAVVFASKSECY